MNNQPIFFSKDEKIYEAQINSTIKNLTDNIFTNVVVQQISDKGDNKYGVLLISAKPGWDKEFVVEGLDNITI